MNIQELIDNSETPIEIKRILMDVSSYVRVLEKQRAELVDAVIETGLTGILPTDILTRVTNGEYGNV